MSMLLGALAPIVVCLGLGFLAGARHDFTAPQAAVLNRMVMLYALPLSLFAGVMAVPRERLFSNLAVLAWIVGAMTVGWVVVFAVARYWARRPAPVAALQALAISSPAVPFVGSSVLPDLFHSEAALAIAIGSLVVNIVQVPMAMAVLTRAGLTRAGLTAGANLRRTFAEPVVWSPLAAFALVALGVGLPRAVAGSLTLLGQATGGVALFASGATMFAQKVSVSRMVWVNVAARNLLMPALVWGLMAAAGVGGSTTALVVATLAIPSGSIGTILAIRFETATRELASTLFVSTVTSALTMGLFLFWTGA
ncbi:MAG: AEC family transporter [Bifidobacteriaceae bacterium]|jgi:predicted permease|nr:AEC family transporter [Bifidobacteriaceae bacterium]